tara:strand:+ start:3483 stop:3836 length:354 start_codon:yes stop_codon:yes gene_type:complete
MGLLTDAIEKMEGMEMPETNFVEFFSNNGSTIAMLLAGAVGIALVLVLLSAPFWKLSKRFVQQEGDIMTRGIVSFLMLVGSMMVTSTIYIIASNPTVVKIISSDIATAVSNLINWLI